MRCFQATWRKSLKTILSAGFSPTVSPEPIVQTAVVIFLAYSCKKRGVCPSCNTKHMIFITLHLLEEVLPKLPLRQWVLSVPKWRRYHLTKDAALASQVLRIFIDEIEKKLKKLCDGILGGCQIT